MDTGIFAGLLDTASLEQAARLPGAARSAALETIDDGWTWEIDIMCALVLGAWLFGLLQVLQLAR